MIKYVPEMTSVVIEEIPDRVTLAVDISNKVIALDAILLF